MSSTLDNSVFETSIYSGTEACFQMDVITASNVSLTDFSTTATATTGGSWSIPRKPPLSSKNFWEDFLATAKPPNDTVFGLIEELFEEFPKYQVGYGDKGSYLTSFTIPMLGFEYTFYLWLTPSNTSRIPKLKRELAYRTYGHILKVISRFKVQGYLAKDENPHLSLGLLKVLYYQHLHLYKKRGGGGSKNRKELSPERSIIRDFKTDKHSRNKGR